MQQQIAVYPGTFDPITNGHIDILKRACLYFDRIVLAVVDSTSKKTVFDVKERLAMATTAVIHLPNVDVLAFNGLLVEFVRTQKGRVILRGLRAVSDFDLEFQLATMNRKLAPDIETMFLIAQESHTFISSSMVREIAAFNGDVSYLVPAHVQQALQQRQPSITGITKG